MHKGSFNGAASGLHFRFHAKHLGCTFNSNKRNLTSVNSRKKNTVIIMREKKNGTENIKKLEISKAKSMAILKGQELTNNKNPDNSKKRPTYTHTHPIPSVIYKVAVQLVGFVW